MLVGLFFLVAGVLVWRLMSGPVDVGFAKGYIEQALYNPVSGYSVVLDSVVVGWPDLHGPIVLDVGGVELVKDGMSVLVVENVSLGLATRYLFIGDIKPVSIVLAQPVLHLIRTDKNEIKFALDDGNAPAPEEIKDEENPLMRVINILSQPQDEVDRDAPLGRLQSIEITGTKMVMADYLLGITWFLSPLDLSFARDERGLMITASAELPGGRNRAARIQTDLVYLREQKNFIANIHIQDFDPHILSRKIEELDWLNDHYAILNGNVELGFDTDFHVHKAAISLSSMNGAILLDGVYDDLLPFEEMFLEAVYDEEQGLADLKDFSIKTKGVSVSVSSPVKIGEGSFSAPVTIKIPNLPQDHIASLWPDVLRGDGAEIWLTQKLSKGRIHDSVAKFDVQIDQKEDLWAVDVKNIVADFTIENMDIDYRAPLDPVTKASGSGHFEGDILVIGLKEGSLRDDLTINKGTVTLDKIMEGGGEAKINIDLSGPLQSVLHFIEPEPIGMNEEKLGLHVDDVKGQAHLDINVSFPTIRDLLAEQVIVKAEGTLSDVLLPNVVKSLDLSGGPLMLKIDDGAAQISGKGLLDGRDIEFAWKEYVNPEGKEFTSQVKAKLVADKGLRDELGIGLEGWISGSFPVDVSYTEYDDDRAGADVKVDLAPGTLMITPMDYTKNTGAKGSASFAIALRNGFVREVKNLDVETSQLRINDARFVFDIVKGEAALRKGKLPEFFLDENSLDIDMEFSRNNELKMSVTGAFFDARPFLNDKKKKEKYDGPAITASLDVDRMRTHPARMVDKVKLYLDMNKKGDVDQFEMDAVAGKGDVYLRLKPNEKGIMALRLEADDAGATLKAFDMYENVEGGKLVLHGEAANKTERKILYGSAEMTDFNVVKAPALAQLLSAISLLGIQQLLGGEGLYFSRLESDFEWHMRREGDQYIIEEGRTSGSSLGLTFEGNIDKAIDRIEMNGTIVPVSFVNEIVSAIPLIGDILTGGGGGIIAATYEVEGPIKKPEVSVNPLSALAPGILRTILFE